MPLKNLTMSANELSEEVLEKILNGLVLYNESSKIVLFTPLAKKLNNIEKILLFLIALKGWRFILDKNRPLDRIKPKELEKKLKIPGNSLRPLLLRLYKREGFVDKDDNGYFVPDFIVSDVGKFLRKEVIKK